jgi:hypothetical protein
MKHKSAREWATTMGASAELLSASLLWATGVAVGPWLPIAMGVLDLTGITLLLSMLICGFVPSLLLGGLLGRARAWRLLAACGAVGPCLWIADFTIMSDPDVHTDGAMVVAAVGFVILVLIIAPLVAGAVAGRICCRPSATQ